jgi:hypothetical protein
MEPKEKSTLTGKSFPDKYASKLHEPRLNNGITSHIPTKKENARISNITYSLFKYNKGKIGK